jgi:type IV pilus assembly protein PilV
MQLVNRNRCRSSQAAAARGFTLIEVLVALIITAIGLLGIAKIQALAYANTGTASVRSLVAIQAAGLASAMHANRSYWAAGAAPASFSMTGSSTGVVFSDTTLAGAATGTCMLGGVPTFCDCMLGGALAPCSPASMAAFDLHTWASALNAQLGNSNPVTTIACPTGFTPINCTITVTWDEKSVALNAEAKAGTTTGTTATFLPTYKLYVQP